MSKPFIAIVVGFSIVPGLPESAHALATAKPQFIWNQQEREAQPGSTDVTTLH